MTVTSVPAEITTLCAALAEGTRWEILTALGSEDLSASDLARALPVSRQAITKHLQVLESAGLVERTRAVPESTSGPVRYHALGALLAHLAAQLETIGRGWDRRLATIKEVAEAREKE